MLVLPDDVMVNDAGKVVYVDDGTTAPMVKHPAVFPFAIDSDGRMLSMPRVFSRDAYGR